MHFVINWRFIGCAAFGCHNFNGTELCQNIAMPIALIYNVCVGCVPHGL